MDIAACSWWCRSTGKHRLCLCLGTNHKVPCINNRWGEWRLMIMIMARSTDTGGQLRVCRGHTCIKSVMKLFYPLISEHSKSNNLITQCASPLTCSWRGRGNGQLQEFVGWSIPASCGAIMGEYSFSKPLILIIKE